MEIVSCNKTNFIVLHLYKNLNQMERLFESLGKTDCFYPNFYFRKIYSSLSFMTLNLSLMRNQLNEQDKLTIIH